MRLLVTGGTGFLGRHLVHALLARGDTVRVLGRNKEVGAELTAAGATVCRVDLRDRAAVIAACAGMDAVIHAGALSAPWGQRAEFYATNVGGTEAVIAGCRQHRVQRLLYVSSPSVVFDGRDHLNLTEAAPYPPRFTSVYSLTKKLGEDRVNAARDLKTVILRPKAIFGPGDTSLLPRLLDAARQHRLPQIGDGRNLVDLTYVDNVVHALLLALAAEQAIGKSYTITNDEHVPLWEVIYQLLEQLKLPTTLRRLPLSVALAAAMVMELHAAVTNSEPLLTRYSTLILARTQCYDIGAARRDLGYVPRTSVAEGIERTLAALGTAKRKT